ncbi:MAG: HNH endonuclease [Lachnospiraceae bacterium]
MGKSKQARAHEFTKAAREKIYTRDCHRCIFCSQGYAMEGATWFSSSILSVMHYIPRSRGGLGIPENGALGCQYHHEMMDNGNKGNRQEMLKIFSAYLQAHYPEWSEEKLIYKKW